MKYKVTIVGDETGYEEFVEVDGKTVFSRGMKAQEYGAKESFSNPKEEELEPDLLEIVEELGSLGFNLLMIARNS